MGIKCGCPISVTAGETGSRVSGPSPDLPMSVGRSQRAAQQSRAGPEPGQSALPHTGFALQYLQLKSENCRDLMLNLFANGSLPAVSQSCQICSL